MEVSLATIEAYLQDEGRLYAKYLFHILTIYCKSLRF